MGRQQGIRIKIGQVVSMGQQKIPALKEGAVGPDRATGAEQLVFMNEIDPVLPARCGNIVPHLVRQPVRIDQDPFNACIDQKLAPVVEQWPAVNRHEAFGNRIGQRTQS